MKKTKQIFYAFILTLTLAFNPATLNAATGTAEKASQHSGTFTKKQKKIQGGWHIESSGTKHTLVFAENFKTKKGPDLKIFLSPQTVQNADGKTATQGSVFVAELKSTKGAQRYTLPAGVQPSNYKSVLVHCEKYSVLWGGGNLKNL